MSLELIDSKKESKIISEPYLYTLKAEKAGIYFVEITARAKSHWQNHSLNKQADDELLVKINGSDEFIKTGATKWNGNELKNLQKTVVFITYLEKGVYNWNLIPKNKPYLQEINVYRTQDDKITFIPKINNPSQDGDRRPWYKFVLVNLGLNKLTVRAKAKKQFFSFDDDDLKILIDNEPAKNEGKKSHKDWFWCGKILRGKSKELTREFPSNSSPKSIEFYSDRTPLLEEVSFEFKKPFQPLPSVSPKIQTYNRIDQNDYNRFDNEIVKAVEDWNVFFTKQEYPPTEPLDPNLIKAMIYIETRMGYGAGSNQAYPDVMQVWDEANKTPQTIKGLSGYPANEFISKTAYGHMKYSYPEKYLPPQVTNPKESIFWGTRWLYNKAQDYYGITGQKGIQDPPYVREWVNWEQAVLNYNANPNLKIRTDYQNNVLKLYQKGQGPDGVKLW